MLYKILPNHLKVSQYLMMLQEMFKEWIRNNTVNLVVLAIGITISFVVGLTITGDVTAGTHRGR